MEPKYRQIAADLERRLKAREWAVGTPLPGLSELKVHYDASLNVVRGAQALMIEAGLLRSVQGKGVFVVRLPPDDFVDAHAHAKQRLADAEAALVDARAVLESDDDTTVLDEDQQISGPAYLRGVVAGQVIVRSGGHLRLVGAVRRGLIVEDGGRAEIERTASVQNLLIEPGGQAILRGTAYGVIENTAGGQLVIEGSIVGELLGKDEDGTVMRPGATIKRFDEAAARLGRNPRE